MNNTIDFNGTLLRLVPHEPDNGYRFYVADDGLIDGLMQGLRIAPNGEQTLVKASPTTSENSTDHYDAIRKQRYWYFANAFGHGKHILVHHAVYRAWVGPFDRTKHIDHLDGITTHNHYTNLEPVTIPENNRRASILRAMRKAGLDPTTYTADQLRAIFRKHDVPPGTVLPDCSIEPLCDV